MAAMGLTFMGAFGHEFRTDIRNADYWEKLPSFRIDERSVFWCFGEKPQNSANFRKLARPLRIPVHPVGMAHRKVTNQEF